MKNPSGFTLIEVLLALAIIAIAFTALLQSISTSINHTTRLKEKTISHWVAMQGVSMIQLGLLPMQKEASEVTSYFGQRWYWRAQLSKTAIPFVSKITITLSQNSSGPFTNPLVAYRYEP